MLYALVMMKVVLLLEELNLWLDMMVKEEWWRVFWRRQIATAWDAVYILVSWCLSP